MTTLNGSLGMEGSGRSRRFGRIGTAALALVIAAGGAVALAGGAPADGTKGAPTAAVSVANSLSAAFRGAAAKIDPSVVSIQVTKKAEEPAGMAMGGAQIPEEFRRFFGGGMPFGQRGPGSPTPTPHAPKARGEGSGVIVSTDGNILTNNHVVADAETITVLLKDGRELSATVVGTDPDTDLAVVKIDASGLTAAKIGDSDTLQPGDWVVAVGSPFGLTHTVTAGVVSAKSRADVGLNTFEDFIQTDAAINPGNSGGPLINLDGEVVGINSAIRSGGGGNIGIGFAIPSTTFNKVMGSLIASGKVERGWLGVSTQTLTQDLATSLSAQSNRGALVADVMPGTPAANGGLQSGDIITSVNGREIASSRELVNAVGGLSPGEKAKLTLLRGGEGKTLTINLGTRPGNLANAAPSASEPEKGTALGMSLQPLTEDLAKQFGMKDADGVLIADVEEGSIAAEAGLRSGDIILEAGGKTATSPADIAAAAKAGEKSLLLKIRRENTARFVVLKTGA